ncbi:Hpt domain-containing protein [Roseinatronobacter alkalisoli]|uniref:Hpt domain-containing protein n=1 Tax=Roseinatronobacter alkalisoli TaxID=3028235 RepID=A0ABT5T4U9_9RHOB|nr:Hpt domain-containing protein [Roseinatronobacter sp. HJB301]MDD7969740.1 Hpt domain-containing protein [Roseinatronobacter sp. HJB301]
MTSEVLDHETLAALLEAGGIEIAAALAEQLTNDFTRIHDSADAQISRLDLGEKPDFKAIHMIAHEMKGLALTIGAHKLADVSLRAEVLARDKDGEALASHLPEFTALCDRVRDALEQSIESLIT